MNVTGCNTGAEPSVAPAVSLERKSIAAALQGRPDERTVASMRVIHTTLAPNEEDYLLHIDWSLVNATNAVADPVVRKALVALAGANDAASATAVAPPKQQTFDVLTTSPAAGFLQPLNDPAGSHSTDMYADAVTEMKACYGVAACNGPPCAAAVLAAHLTVYGPIGSTPIEPGYADKGAWQCEISFGAGGGNSSCSLRGHCTNAEVEFPAKGKSCSVPNCYKCNDAGWQPGPNPQKCTYPTYEERNGGNPDDGGGREENICFTSFHGASPSLENPTAYKACAGLSTPTKHVGTPLICLDESAYVQPPRLPSGGRPEVECVRLDSSSAKAGGVDDFGSDCDGQYGLTCWCCP